jgi:hypothetical protein
VTEDESQGPGQTTMRLVDTLPEWAMGAEVSGLLGPLKEGARTRQPRSRRRTPTGRPERFSVEQVRLAVTRSDGCLRAVAHALRCSRSTVQNYFRRYPDLYTEAVQAREGMLDEAEGQLYKLVRAGNLGAICFLLKTQGKSRGYTERPERPVPQHDLSRLTDEELLVLGPILTKLNGPAPTGWAPPPDTTNL